MAVEGEVVQYSVVGVGGSGVVGGGVVWLRVWVEAVCGGLGGGGGGGGERRRRIRIRNGKRRG